jgi:DNA/RNA-binding domain of Phe-tRNA-synthetase-like protein
MHPVEIEITENWQRTFPGAQIGLLLLAGIDNSQRYAALDEHKQQLEGEIRDRYSGYERSRLLQLDVLRAYKEYYRRFNKTYHVLLQLESVIAGKSLPAVSPLVDACFSAELDSHMLTASHDAASLVGEVAIDAAQGGEQLTQLGGAIKRVPPGDMLMRDALGVVCTVIYGPDQRTAITTSTTAALYVTYVPPGITAETVHAHQETIKAIVLRFAPQAEIGYLRVISA